jgi:tRNA 2-thiouridine synthesizing protein D
MKYALQINHSPQTQRAYSAYLFIKALLAQGHQVIRVFFYHDGIYHAFRYNTPPDDELQMASLWQQLAEQHGIDLVICISAAQRRGLLCPPESLRQGKKDNDLADGFCIAGLGQWVEAGLQADRFIVFG